MGRVAEVLREIINGQCEDIKTDILALEIKPDHLHLFVGAKPTHTPYKIVKKLKGNTSTQLRKLFKHLHFLGYQRHYKKFPNLWAIGYYCGSAGHVSQESVRKYIEEQQGKDVFEYSVYGSPDQKIGDFTKQSKLGGWT